MDISLPEAKGECGVIHRRGYVTMIVSGSLIKVDGSAHGIRILLGKKVTPLTSLPSSL